MNYNLILVTVETPKLQLKSLQTVSCDAWRNERFTDTLELCVSVSGYEARCTDWSRKTIPASFRTFAVLGFTEMRDSLSRPASDRFYYDRGCDVVNFSRDDSTGVLMSIQKAIQLAQTPETRLHVHIDYSCMPRNWYCNLPLFLERILRKDDMAYFWYTAGNYPTGEYPTAGASDFRVFAGRASLSAKFRTHVFGLGFDRIRANAICSVLDPQYLICFYATPGVKDEYVRKVEIDNADILRQANLTFTAPLNDFNAAFTRLCSIANEFKELGDVVFVPDGPKPLVLASSLVPLAIQTTGTVCFHVSRRKMQDKQPVDVVATGECYGFSFAGIV
jgi:hypothetical protein